MHHFYLDSTKTKASRLCGGRKLGILIWKLRSKDTNIRMEVSWQKISNCYSQRVQAWTNNDGFPIEKCYLSNNQLSRFCEQIQYTVMVFKISG